MTELITTPNLTDADGFYEALIAAHDGLTPEQSTALNARLILLLANHVGDREILLAALKKARETGR
tara:strand:- start:196 stop:393 length:198 start_codon:yes stop_codon:yes gene_type:complete